MISCPQKIHFLSKNIPQPGCRRHSRTVQGNDQTRIPLFEFLHRGDERFIMKSVEVETTHDPQQRIFTPDIGRMPDCIHHARMAAAADKIETPPGLPDDKRFIVRHNVLDELTRFLFEQTTKRF